MFPKIYLLKKETERDKIERNRDRINYEKYKKMYLIKKIFILTIVLHPVSSLALCNLYVYKIYNMKL